MVGILGLPIKNFRSVGRSFTSSLTNGWVVAGLMFLWNMTWYGITGGFWTLMMTSLSRLKDTLSCRKFIISTTPSVNVKHLISSDSRESKGMLVLSFPNCDHGSFMGRSRMTLVKPRCVMLAHALRKETRLYVTTILVNISLRTVWAKAIPLSNGCVMLFNSTSTAWGQTFTKSLVEFFTRIFMPKTISTTFCHFRQTVRSFCLSSWLRNEKILTSSC